MKIWIVRQKDDTNTLIDGKGIFRVYDFFDLYKLVCTEKDPQKCRPRFKVDKGSNWQPGSHLCEKLQET